MAMLTWVLQPFGFREHPGSGSCSCKFTRLLPVWGAAGVPRGELNGSGGALDLGIVQTVSIVLDTFGERRAKPFGKEASSWPVRNLAVKPS